MVKFHLPSSSSYSSATNDGRFIFYLGKTVNVFDTSILKKVATLPRLGNSKMAVSRDDTYLGCIHPTNRGVEAVLYKIEKPPVEVFRILIKESYHTCAPCFTYDSRYLLVTAGFPKVTLYAINVETGFVSPMYETTDSCTIAGVISTRKGIIVVEHECLIPSIECPSGRLLIFQTVSSSPIVTNFDKLTCDKVRKQLCSSFLWTNVVSLTQETLLLVYQYASSTPETRLEVISLPTGEILRPAPQVCVPYFILLPPVASTDGKYVAFIGTRPGQIGNYVCVYRTADWLPVYVENQEYVWDLKFIPGTADLIISGKVSCVVMVSQPQ